MRKKFIRALKRREILPEEATIKMYSCIDRGIKVYEVWYEIWYEYKDTKRIAKGASYYFLLSSAGRLKEYTNFRGYYHHKKA